MDLTLRQMQLADLSFLQGFSQEAYRLNFQHHWEPGGIDLYLKEVFGRRILANELADPSLLYYVVYKNDLPLAFMKLDLHSNLPGLDPNTGLELDKLYVLPFAQGSGAGKLLMQKAFALAKEREKKNFWLSVIDTNKNAIAFYERWGFRLHSKTRIILPGFRDDLRGMWRMSLALHPCFPPSV